MQIPPEPGTTSGSAITARLAGELSGRYTIVRELGRGGMATVFLAKDEKHGRDVAIKVLHPELSASIGGDRFEREIRTVASMQHPNILGLYDSGSANGLLYYVMPFVEGMSLRDKIDKEGQLSVDDAVRIALEVASALGYAHGKGIIHRDIKPENILLSGDLTLVADFGIAKAASEANQQKLTQTGMAVGTPLYMAPEQAGGEAVGPTADIYSLGCMLYEMLAGEPPFTGKNPVAIMARHAMEQVPSIRIVRSSVPAEVEEAIFASMGKVPADRPQTAAAFAEILGMPLGSTTTMRVRGRTTAYAVVAPPKKSRTVIYGAAVAALLLATAGGAYWYRANSSAPEVVGFSPSRIAVLYFNDLSRGGELGHVADALTETLIDELRQVQNLDVVSTNGVLPFRGTNARRDSIARELSAGTLVDGTVENSGAERVRVNVRLIDGNSGADLGSDARTSFEAPANNLLAIRDTVRTRVAALVQRRVGAEVRLQEQRAGTSNPAAWSLVQQALRLRKDAAADWRAGNRDEVVRKYVSVDSLLAEAERLDPRWAEPAVQRGQLAFRRSMITDDRFEVIRITEEGLEHAQRVLAREPQNAAALELRGTMLFQRLAKGVVADPRESANLLNQAETLFDEAARRDPQRTFALYALSFINYNKGEIESAKNYARRAFEQDAYLDNAEAVVDLLYATSYALEQPDAVQYCDIGARRFPENAIFRQCQLELLGTRHRQPDVNAAWRLVGELEPLVAKPAWELKRREAQMYVAAVIARAGMPDSARRVLERSRGNPELDPYGLLLRLEIWVRSLVGDNDEAVRLANRLLTIDPEWRHQEQKFPHWWYRTLRSTDPRFEALVGG